MMLRTAGSTRARTATPDSPPSGANVNGSSSQAAYSLANRVSTSPAAQALPVAVADLTQPVAHCRLEAAAFGDDVCRFHGTREWAAVDRANRIIPQARRETLNL